MRIFSEDETLVSVGSGSLMSNSSPRILPGHKISKSLVGSFDVLLPTLPVVSGQAFENNQRLMKSALVPDQ